MIRRGPAATGSAGFVVGAEAVSVGAGAVSLGAGVVLLRVFAGLVRVVLAVPGRLRVVTGFGGCDFAASVVGAEVSVGAGVSVEGCAGVVVSGLVSATVGCGSGSSMRAPVAVTLLPLLADETVGTTGSGSGTSRLIGSNVPSKRTRKLPSLSLGVRASMRSIRDSRVLK